MREGKKPERINKEFLSKEELLLNILYNQWEQYHEQELAKERAKRLSRDKLIHVINLFIKKLTLKSKSFGLNEQSELADAIIKAQENK
jgi:hypothetical protein